MHTNKTSGQERPEESSNQPENIIDQMDVPPPDAPTHESALKRFYDDINRIRNNARRRIKPEPPLLTIDGLPVFFPNTVNFIQGQAGVHKSRLAQNFVAAVLAQENSTNEQRLGIQCHNERPLSVAYIDTERNMREQFPAAIQEIRQAAGYSSLEETEDFTPASLINVPRSERLSIVQEFVRRQRSNTNKHLLIVVDVVTDCIGDFNVPSQAFELIDFMNRLSDREDVTFICVIHENPGSTKARGHVGTELENKASTVLQIARMKAKSETDQEVYAIVFKKTRSSKRHDSLYVAFDEATGNLVRCEKPSANGPIGNPKDQQLREEIVVFLQFGEEKTRKDFCLHLAGVTGDKEATIAKKLNKLIAEGATFDTINGMKVLVVAKKGKETVYKLVDHEDPDQAPDTEEEE